MKLKDSQVSYLVKAIVNEWKKLGLVVFKASEETVVQRLMERFREENQKLVTLEEELKKMLDELEMKQPGGFDRQKMYGLLRQRLAKERGIIL